MKYKLNENYVHGDERKIGVLLVNLGTPDAPTTSAVRKYLSEFLSDPRIVEIPRLIWWLIFFISLPINIKKSRSGNYIEGEDPGAPNNPQLFRKFLITTVVSIVIWFIIYSFLNNEGFLMYILKLFYINEVI